MFLNRKNLIVIILIVLLILSINFLLITYSDFYQTIRNKVLDLLYPLQSFIFPPPSEANQIVIFAIDNETLTATDMRWPWERKFFAEILNEVRISNPKTIVLDFFLFGESKEEDDLILSNSIIEADNIILPSYYDLDMKLNRPLEIFSVFAKKIGYVNKISDNDGAIRRFNPFHIDESGGIDNYTLEIGILGYSYNIKEEDIAKEIPLKKDGTAYINYLLKPEDFTTYSLKDIFNKNINPDILKDKIILLGGTSDIIHDIYPTPMGNMHGVYIIANTLLTIISKRFLIDMDFPWLLFILGFSSFLIALLTFKHGFGKSIIGIFLFSIVFFSASFFIFRKGIIIDFFSPIFAMLSTAITVSFYRYITILRKNIKDLEEANIKIKNAQNEIIRREQLATIGKLTSIIIHELNNPLGNLSDLIEMLKEGIKEPSETQRILDLAHKEVTRALKMGSDLKTSYTPHIDEKTPVNINDILLDIVETSNSRIKSKGITLELNLGDKIPLVSVSRDKIKQVFLNILLNAIDATKQGRHIYISTKTSKDEGGKDWVDIINRDEGCGIPKEELDNIFNAFQTTKKDRKGSGLGLFISYEIVKAHQGRIFVESTVGKGSTFTVRLPITN